jgi:phosphoribosylaminoimidazole-succinocarboxamide synthase
MEALLQTKIAGITPKRGKVRDVYTIGDKLLIVATDRLSAFDVVMKTPIPYKGQVLTQISKFWFEFFGDQFEHHLITDNVSKYPKPFKDYPSQLTGRSMLVKKVEVLPVECVVRGYLAGSSWKEYKESQTVCGIKLPAGLKQCDKLPEPIFTPATKEESVYYEGEKLFYEGSPVFTQAKHDENIDFERCVGILGEKRAEYVRDSSLAIFERAGEYARQKGIILADTKFEWGVSNGSIILIDEVLTPDSSRFWPADKYQSGRDQESFDKQFVRNYLEEIKFDKSGPGIELPENIVKKTSEKYIEAYERLTGRSFKR